MVGRYQKYSSAEVLDEAVRGYFASISSVRPVMEEYLTDKKDEWGHRITARRPVMNSLGLPVVERIYAVPPTLGGLVEHLHISRDTWRRYRTEDKYKRFHEICEWAEEQLLAYAEVEALRRPSKTIRGVERALERDLSRRSAEEARAAERAEEEAALTMSEKREILREIGASFGK